jgi:NAD(+) diphosphatase
MDLPMASGQFDRDAARRNDANYLHLLKNSPNTSYILVTARGEVAIKSDHVYGQAPRGGLTPPDLANMEAEQLLELNHAQVAQLPFSPQEPYYLGKYGEKSYFALRVEAPSQQLEENWQHCFAPLRAVAGMLEPYQGELAAAAVALATWDKNTKFCERCGVSLKLACAGWEKHCTACAHITYPRTDPAIIVAITDDAERLLLIHGATWQPGRYSVVAGFVEAGESLEAAVAREALEETGIKISQASYCASQPWPFPRSLMFAFTARAGGQQEPKADMQEVGHAFWASREEFTQLVLEGKVIVPGRASSGHALVRAWYGRELPQPR